MALSVGATAALACMLDGSTSCTLISKAGTQSTVGSAALKAGSDDSTQVPVYSSMPASLQLLGSWILQAKVVHEVLVGLSVGEAPQRVHVGCSGRGVALAPFALLLGQLLSHAVGREVFGRPFFS